MTYDLPWPPSVNHYWKQDHKRGRTYLSKEAVNFRTEVYFRCWSGNRNIRPLTGRVKMLIHVHPPDRRTRDIDNIAKAILDSLKHAEVYGDDSQIDDLHIMRCEVEKPGRVLVTVEEVENVAA